MHPLPSRACCTTDDGTAALPAARAFLSFPSSTFYLIFLLKFIPLPLFNNKTIPFFHAQLNARGAYRTQTTNATRCARSPPLCCPPRVRCKQENVAGQARETPAAGPHVLTASHVWTWNMELCNERRTAAHSSRKKVRGEAEGEGSKSKQAGRMAEVRRWPVACGRVCSCHKSHKLGVCESKRQEVGEVGR
jgi:hypothetical protein